MLKISYIIDLRISVYTSIIEIYKMLWWKIAINIDDITHIHIFINSSSLIIIFKNLKIENSKKLKLENLLNNHTFQTNIFTQKYKIISIFQRNFAVSRCQELLIAIVFFFFFFFISIAVNHIRGWNTFSVATGASVCWKTI